MSASLPPWPTRPAARTAPAADVTDGVDTVAAVSAVGSRFHCAWAVNAGDAVGCAKPARLATAWTPVPIPIGTASARQATSARPVAHRRVLFIVSVPLPFVK